MTISCSASNSVKWVNYYVNGGWIASTGRGNCSTNWNSRKVANGGNTLSVAAYGWNNSVIGNNFEIVNVSNNLPTPTPAPTPTPTATPTPTPTPIPTPTPTATPTPTPTTLDQYGGVTNVACPSGTQPRFYTQKIGDRWWICTPAGHGFFIRSVVGVNYGWTSTWGTGALQTKYGTYDGSGSNPYTTTQSGIWDLNYDIQQVNRLRAWGFNWLAEGAVVQPANVDGRWNTPDHTIPNQFKMPFEIGSNLTIYAMLPSVFTGHGCNTTYSLKDIVQGVNPAAYNTGYRGYNYADYFDPHFAACANAIWNNTLSASAQSPYASYLGYVVLDESDETGFLKRGPEFQAIDAGGNLIDLGLGGHPAWATLGTKPIQSSAAPQGHSATYTDQEIYSKVQLANDLLNHYLNVAAGTYSIDPAATNYAGAANMAAAVAALNAAWSSYYSTLSTADTSDCGSNLAGCLQAGTYNGWGTGTGLLDEDGSCPAKGTHSCWMGDDITLSGETAAMRSDMSAFYTHYLTQYFSTTVAGVHAYAPGVMTEMDVGSAGAPPRKEVL